MSFHSDDVPEIFPDFSFLFDQAKKMHVKIEPHAPSQLLSLTTQLDPRMIAPVGTQRAAALAAWSDLVRQNQGQMLATNDIWEWIKKWVIPDPVQSEMIQRIWTQVLKQSQGFTDRK